MRQLRHPFIQYQPAIAAKFADNVQGLLMLAFFFALRQLRNTLMNTILGYEDRNIFRSSAFQEWFNTAMEYDTMLRRMHPEVEGTIGNNLEELEIIWADLLKKHTMESNNCVENLAFSLEEESESSREGGSHSPSITKRDRDSDEDYDQGPQAKRVLWSSDSVTYQISEMHID